MAHTMATADFDGDSDLDLVFGVDDWDVCFGALLTLVNDGSASFTTTAIGTVYNDQARAIAPTDFNGDGYMDFATAMGCDIVGRVHLYMHYLDSTLYDPIKLADNNYGTYDIVTADFDNDGDFDIATANGDIAVFETLKTGGACCRGIRGDVDYDPDDQINISDLVDFVDYMFTGGPPPLCEAEANINGDGQGEYEPWDINDLVYLIDYMFTGGPPPPPCVIIE